MTSINKSLQQTTTSAFERLLTVKNSAELEALKTEFIGRQGIVAQLMDELKNLSLDEKRIYGPELNKLKKTLTDAFSAKQEELEQLILKQKADRASSFDVTAYRPGDLHGSLHPASYVIEEAENILMSMGFEIIDGPEVERDEINFEALNIPKNHPARDLQDTFWLTIPQLLLRTHTSSVQIRGMQQRQPPLALATTGRCYRQEATDASHDFTFMQCEIMLVDKKVSLAHLFATAKLFLQGLFKKDKLEIRIRPSYFPFVEPGLEMDMSCPFCATGCSVCKKSRWIEIGGAGLIHPHVLKAVNINPEEYSGFAFGFGLTRLMMLKYGIDDVRHLHSPKIDFLKQF